MSNVPHTSRRGFLVAGTLSLAGLGVRARGEPVGLGGPCAAATTRAVICGPEEPGERMLVRGRLFAPDGEGPAAGVVVYAYHTDAKGLYNPTPQAPPRLRGYMRTDADGRFEYETIRPASYPGQTIPAHVHHQAWGGRFPTQWLSELNFSDDPLLGDAQREESREAGRFAWILTPRRTSRGLEVDLNLRLKPTGDAFGANIRHGLLACGLP